MKCSKARTGTLQKNLNEVGSTVVGKGMEEFPVDGGSTSIVGKVPGASELRFIRAIKDILREKDLSTQLVDALKQRKNDSFAAIFSSYHSSPKDEKLDFPWILQNWIARQLLPFVNYRVETRSTATLASSNDVENTVKLPVAPVNNINNIDNSSIIKQKKRMTPSVVSAPLSSTNNNMLTSNNDTSNDIRAALLSKRAVESINNIERTPKKDIPAINDKATMTPMTNNLPPAPIVPSKSKHNTDLYTVEKDTTEANDAASDAESLQVIRRLSKIYSLLILNNYLPYSHALPFVSRVVSLQTIYDHPIVVAVTDQNEFPSVILSSKLLQDFMMKLLNDLKPVIKCLGSAYINSLVNLRVLKEHAPALIAELTSVVEETSNSAGGNASQSLPRGPEAFIRPFREEIDSRNEYKSPLESGLYNERESCYDEFTNCFHRFQDVLKSDYDGSKIKEFFVNNSLQATKVKVLAMQDVNFIWFGEIFKQMLLFYGVNSSVGGNASYKSRLLERLGGGKVTADVTTESPGHTFSNAGSDKTAARDCYQVPATNFPGNQQFFFRFIISCDSHRLSSCLVAAFTAEIYDLSALNSAVTSPVRASSTTSGKVASNSSKDRSNDTYSLRIIKLKLLGKFLGLLHFYSQWVLSVPLSPKYKGGISAGEGTAEPSGPISLLLEESVRSRALFRSILPIKHVLEVAYSGNRYLSLTVPWICEFLKMIVFDSHYHLDNPYADILGLLKSLQRADSYCPLKCAEISPNKLYLLLEIEALWGVIPAESVRVAALPPLLASKSDGEKGMATSTFPPHFFDEGSGAFSDAVFNTSVTPCISACIQYMRAASIATKATVEKTTASSARVIPKRQTPNIISKTHVDANPTFAGCGADNGTPLSVRPKSNDSTNSLVTSSEKKSTSRISLFNPSTVSPAKGFSEINTQSASFTFSSPSSPKKVAGSVSYGSYMSSPTLNSPSMSSPAKGDEVGSVCGTLEAAFWQQHSNLYQICSFLIDNLHTACTAHLKDRVAEAILDLWSVSGRMKLALENILSSNSSSSSSVTISEYKRDLSVASKRLHEVTVKDGNEFIQEFIERHIQSTLRELCYHLYPNYHKVSSLAEKLMTNQIRFQQGSLMQYLDSYSLRKFDEVVTASLRQYQKLIDGSTKKIVSAPTRVPAQSRGNPCEVKRISFANEDMDSSRFRDLLHIVISKLVIYFQVQPSDSYPNVDPVDLLLSPIRVSVREDAYQRCDGVALRNNIAMTIDILKEFCLVIAAYYSVEQTNSTSMQLTSHVGAAVTVLRVFLAWINALTKSSATERPIADKVLIDTYKFLTIISPILIFFDYLVAGASEGGSLCASDVLLEALFDHKLVVTSTFIRLLITTARPTTGTHYEVFRGLTNISKISNIYILKLIKRFLLQHAEISDLIPPVDSCGTGEEWYQDSSLLHVIRNRFGPELPILIAKLFSIGNTEKIERKIEKEL